MNLQSLVNSRFFFIENKEVSFKLDNLQPYKISLDFYIRKIITVNAKQLDSDSRVINITCTENGKKFLSLCEIWIR